MVILIASHVGTSFLYVNGQSQPKSRTLGFPIAIESRRLLKKRLVSLKRSDLEHSVWLTQASARPHRNWQHSVYVMLDFTFLDVIEKQSKKLGDGDDGDVHASPPIHPYIRGHFLDCFLITSRNVKSIITYTECCQFLWGRAEA